MARPEIIVSLASYPPRIGTVADALQPLFRQTVPPDRILLWLPSHEFEDSGTALPGELADLERQVPSFEIRWIGESLRPHNKYFWAMQEFPDAMLITVDDDLVHRVTLVQDLLNAHFRFPDAVIASRSHTVTLAPDGDLAPYGSWEFEQTRFLNEPRFDLCATNGAGSLFPPRALLPEAFDAQAVSELCLRTDDLWLMAWTCMSNRPVVSVGAPGLCYIPGTQEVGLYQENLDRYGNDDSLARLYARFPQFHDDLVRFVGARVAEEERAAQQAAAGQAHAEANPSAARRIVRRLRRAFA